MPKGACLCGAVSFETTANLNAADACHCSMCRKWTGHFFVGTEVPRAALAIHGADKVTWYRSSEKVRRGFCSICGSSLFWDPIDQVKHDWTGVMMGALELPTEIRLRMHIYVADKGDYYEITDGLPHHEQ